MQFKFFLFLCMLVASFASLVKSENSEGRDELDLCNSGYSESLAKGDVLIENYSETTIPTERNSISTSISLWNDFPILSLVFASSNTIPEGRCKKQARRYLQDLANATLWAVQMFDASTKYPDGIIFGHTQHLGNFDQCYNLRAKLPSDENDPESYDDNVEGRYCLIRFQYQRKNFSPTTPEFLTIDFDPNESAWEAVDERGDFRRVKRNSIEMALCVPSSCTAEEVEVAITDPLKKLAEDRGIRLAIDVESPLCQARSDEPENFSTGTKVFCLIITALLLLVIGSSWYDSSRYSAEDVENKIEPKNFFLCFSARRNLRSIFETTSGSHPGLKCIHLARFFFTTLIIFGHRSMQYIGLPMVDSTYSEKAFTAPGSMMVFNGLMIIDALFSIGGLLLAYILLGELDRSKRINFVALILARFVRLTPLYMMVLFFNASILPLMGSGPYWQMKIAAKANECAKNWWTNLFYINNYVNANEMCMFQSWYLSVDYQLYIIGIIVLWIFWRLPRKIGYSFLFLLITLGIAIISFITYTKNLPPIFIGSPSMRDPTKDAFFLDQYIKIHVRIAPYFVGVLAGVIIYDYEGATWKLPKVWSQTLFIMLVVVLSLGGQSLAAKYYDPNSVLHPLESAAHAAFFKTAAAIVLCSIVVLITIGDGLEFHYKFLTPRWVVPLSRLCYGACLIHSIIQGYTIGVTRTPRVFSIYDWISEFVADMVYTFSLSLLSSILIEVPIQKLGKFFLSNKISSRNPTEMTSLVNGIKKTN